MEQRRKALVLGAGGFIGSHLVKRLKAEGYCVFAADLKYPEYSFHEADLFIKGDLRNMEFVHRTFWNDPDEVYQLAADMGGSGYIFTGEHDADIMSNSALININVAKVASLKKTKKLFFSSSACIYPAYNQVDAENPNCKENTAYPAAPDSCLHPNTEVLTIDGFKLISDLNSDDLIATLNDRGIMEYHQYLSKQEIDFSGKLINIKTKYLSCSVTPDHNVVECSRTGVELKNTKAKDFIIKNKITKGFFKRNCEWTGILYVDKVKIESIGYSVVKIDSKKKENRKKIGHEFDLNDYVEFISWFVTEGNSGFYNGDYIVQIRQTKQDNLDKIISLCKRMGVHPYVPKDNGRVIIYSKSLYNHFENFGKGANNKFLLLWVLSLPKEQLKIIYTTMMLGDGQELNGKSCYTTTSKKLRDQFVEICLKIGYASSVKHIKKDGRYKDIYHVNISKQHLVHKITNNNISFFDYVGKVFDITIPNHRFYIRHNGKHMWTGNCYGWEKLFSERLYQAYQRNYGLDVRIARFHNIFGPEGSWNNGKEKAPAALCRKVAEAEDVIEIWGDGEQTRSFLYIDECLEGIRRLMEHPQSLEPVNIGSEEMISINELVEMIKEIAGKRTLVVNHVEGPQGVRGRSSDNRLIKEKLGWEPNHLLRSGMIKLYKWINEQVNGK